MNPQEEPMIEFLAWGPNVIWLVNTFGPSLTGLAKINTLNYAVTKYDILEQAGTEFEINVYKEKIAFSSFPAMFDEDSWKEYE